MTTGERDIEDFEDLFDNAPCGYLSLDSSGRILRTNRTLRAWLGYEAHELQGKRFHDLLNIAGKIYYETHFAPLLRMQGSFNEVALDFLMKSGASVPVLVNAHERRDEAGAVKLIGVSVFNVTDRRRYEAELLQAKTVAETASAELRALNASLEARVEHEVAERLKSEDAQRQMQKMEAIGQLAGGIAHDFNNMLAVVIGALNLIERRLRKGEGADDLIAAAKDGATRAAALTHRLLAYARQLPLEPKVLNLNRVVSDISDLLQRTLGEEARLETVLADGLWPVRTDASQLENMIVNLAVNARDAMPDGGRITIETANCHLDDAYAREHVEVAAGQYVMVAVSDTGVGMSADTIARAFEPFFTTKEIGKGTGLGLSQTFGYVKQSGGHIKIYSELGEGTTIKVYLPRHYGEGDVAKIMPARMGAPRGAASETVLIVEDDNRLREIARAMLQELGYLVVDAASAAEALEVLKSDANVSLLLTDIVMPEKNGRVLADEARALRPGLKVLFTTGYTRNAVVHNGMLDAGVSLLSKPFTLDQLAHKVREVLDFV
jgi:PAS domain S-box-containing protein